MSKINNYYMWVLEQAQPEYNPNPGETVLSAKELNHPLVTGAFNVHKEDVKIALRVLKEGRYTHAVFGPNGCFLFPKGGVQ